MILTTYTFLQHQSATHSSCSRAAAEARAQAANAELPRDEQGEEWEPSLVRLSAPVDNKRWILSFEAEERTVETKSSAGGSSAEEGREEAVGGWSRGSRPSEWARQGSVKR